MSKSITNTIKTEVPIYDTDDTDEEEGYSENLKSNCTKSAPIIPKLGNIYFIYREMGLEINDMQRKTFLVPFLDINSECNLVLPLLASQPE